MPTIYIKYLKNEQIIFFFLFFLMIEFKCLFDTYIYYVWAIYG